MSIEKRAYELANDGQKAPAQRLTDFLKGEISKNLPATSYVPGHISVQISDIFPPFVGETLKKGFISFGKKIKNFISPNAVVVGVETRTSSPISIPRDRESYEHVEIKNLYPCGEGAGYAGGIISAAIDGENCVMKFFEKKLNI